MKDYTGELNALYDKKLKNEQDALLRRRDDELRAGEEQAAVLDAKLRQSENALAAERAQQQRNFDERALAQGLSGGAGMQLRLAMDGAANKAMSGLEAQRAAGRREHESLVNDIESRYKSGIAEAIGRNDFERAQALLSEYKNRDKELETRAGLLSNFGDFSLYAQLYGEQTAAGMRDLWIAKNPKLAYNLGLIDRETYYRLK